LINPRSQLAQEFWEHGRLKSCPVFNFHAHMFDASGIFLPRRTPEGMLRSMDESNTLMSFFCGHATLQDASAGEPVDLAVVRKYPDRFRAYHVVVSRRLDPKTDLQRIEENPDLFVGLKFHGDVYNVPISDSRHDPYWEYADAHGLLVLCHTWGKSTFDGPDVVAKVLSKYRKLIFVGAHGFHDEWHRAPEIANEFPNYYFELTAVLDNRGPLDLFLERAKHGSRQVLFGTDLPWFSLHHGIGGVLSVDMTDDDRRNILYRNGVRLLSRFRWFKPLWDACGNGEPCPPG